MTTNTKPKRKLTISLAPEIIQALDETIQTQGGSRSAAISRVLDDWRSREAQQKQERRDLEAAVAAYYTSQSEAEQAEDNDWVMLSGHAAVLSLSKT